MTTIAIPNKKIGRMDGVVRVENGISKTTTTTTTTTTNTNISLGYNKTAIVSMMLAAVFILSFFSLYTASSHMMVKLSLVFLIIIPVITFILSLIAVKQIAQTHERGAALSYIALGISSIYLMTAMAIPLVLICFYIAYSYII